MKLKVDTRIALSSSFDTFCTIKVVPAKFTKHLHGVNL